MAVDEKASLNPDFSNISSQRETHFLAIFSNSHALWNSPIDQQNSRPLVFNKDGMSWKINLVKCQNWSSRGLSNLTYPQVVDWTSLRNSLKKRTLKKIARNLGKNLMLHDVLYQVSQISIMAWVRVLTLKCIGIWQKSVLACLLERQKVDYMQLERLMMQLTYGTTHTQNDEWGRESK